MFPLFKERWGGGAEKVLLCLEGWGGGGGGGTSFGPTIFPFCSPRLPRN